MEENDQREEQQSWLNRDLANLEEYEGDLDDKGDPIRPRNERSMLLLHSLCMGQQA